MRVARIESRIAVSRSTNDILHRTKECRGSDFIMSENGQVLYELYGGTCHASALTLAVGPVRKTSNVSAFRKLIEIAMLAGRRLPQVRLHGGPICHHTCFATAFVPVW